MDCILTIINVICVMFSIAGAIKSVMKYKQIKHLTNYSNINYCYAEFCEIEKQLTSILSLSSISANCRGTNTYKILLESTKKIKNSLIEIRKRLTSQELKAILSFFDNEMDSYIDNIIANANEIELNFIFDEAYKKFQQSVQLSQVFLKENIEKLEKNH